MLDHPTQSQRFNIYIYKEKHNITYIIKYLYPVYKGLSLLSAMFYIKNIAAIVIYAMFMFFLLLGSFPVLF